MLNMKPERKPDPSTGKMVEEYWSSSIKLLSDLKFLDRLKTYDKDNVPSPIMKKIRDKWVYSLLSGRVLHMGSFHVGVQSNIVPLYLADL